MRKVFGKLMVLIKDAIFPNICVCGRWGTPLCEKCKAEVARYKTGLCPICRKLSENGKTCERCRHKSYLTGVMVYGKHKDLLKSVVWRYKYEFHKDLSESCAELVAEAFCDFLEQKSFLITCVPITKQRLAWRGYNQSQLLAKKLAEKLGLEYVELLTKKDNILPQVGKNRKERIENIKGMILPKNEVDLEKRNVVIIDDVYTSGATLEECAKVLRQMGAREVWGLVLSRE